MSNALTTFKQFNECREIQYCFFLDFCHCQMSSVPVFEIWRKTAWIGFGRYNSTSFSTALESYYFTEMTTRCFFEHQPLKPSEQPHWWIWLSKFLMTTTRSEEFASGCKIVMKTLLPTSWNGWAKCLARHFVQLILGYVDKMYSLWPRINLNCWHLATADKYC